MVVVLKSKISVGSFFIPFMLFIMSKLPAYPPRPPPGRTPSPSL